MYKEKFDNNVSLLKFASECYYNGSETIMTDSEYDKLLLETRELSEKYNFKDDFLIKNIGMVINDKPVLNHIKKMYSQKDIFEVDKAIEWCKKKRTKIFYTEPKLDGCSANLIYKDGKLTSVATRGNGLIGQDITMLSDGIINLPKNIEYKDLIEIRGELIMSFKNFDKFKDEFKNPRNLVSGSTSLLDVEKFKERNIEFIPWGLGFTRLKMNKSELKPFFTKLGFKGMPKTTIVSEPNSIVGIYKSFIKERDKFDYPIDGLMIYLIKHEEQAFYSYSDRLPLYSIALKFPAKEVSTILTNVEFNIGRNGNLSIVGVLEPVELLGSTVSKATLHNLNYIKNKDIKIGDKVIIYKAGDIVPAVKESFKNIRTGNEKSIKISKCPYCKNILEDNKGILKCTNVNCSGILKSKLKYAVSKKCLNLQGIGDEFINKMVDNNAVRSIVGFYELDSVSILSALNPKLYKLTDKEFTDAIKSNKYAKEIEKAKKYEKVIQSIKSKPFSLLLESFSITGLGTATCLKLENKSIFTIDELIKYLKDNDNHINRNILSQIDEDIVKYLSN